MQMKLQKAKQNYRTSLEIYKHAGQRLEKLETTVVPQMLMFEEH